MDNQRHNDTAHPGSLSPCHVSPRSLSPRTVSSCLRVCLHQEEGNTKEVGGMVRLPRVNLASFSSPCHRAPCHRGTAATCHQEQLAELTSAYVAAMHKLDELREALHYIDEEGNELYRCDLMALLEVVYSMMHKIKLTAAIPNSGGE